MPSTVYSCDRVAPSDTRRILLGLFSILVMMLYATGTLCRGGEVKPVQTTLDLNNPHKGFMLWGTDFVAGASGNFHGSTIFHVYVPWREIETSNQNFEWDRFEANHLLPILNKYPEATFVLRPVVDYPNGCHSGITNFYQGDERQRDYPKFLEEPPLEIHFTDYKSCNGDGPGKTPDWNDAKMILQLQEFVAAFGKKYDGDARITCVQAGLLGLWGEWHQSGCGNLGPDIPVKEAVRDAYAAAFTKTAVQTRYPRKPDAVGVEFGFYEDFFPSFTAPCSYNFPECSDSGNWNMDWCFKNETPGSKDNWLTSPISGESPLKEQKAIWAGQTKVILTVLRDYHFSMLGPGGAHEWDQDRSAMAMIKRQLGYNYHIDYLRWPDQIVTGQPFEVTLQLSNTGSAPCYHSMPVELSLCGSADSAIWKQRWQFDLRKVIPGKPFRVTQRFTVNKVTTGDYSLRLGIIHPRRNGKPGVLIQSAGRDSNDRYQMGKINVAK
ncbi:MAG: DUF4832 domain-containing protein [Fuerstiella sp.]